MNLRNSVVFRDIKLFTVNISVSFSYLLAYLLLLFLYINGIEARENCGLLFYLKINITVKIVNSNNC